MRDGLKPQPPAAGRRAGNGSSQVSMTRKRAEREAMKRPATGDWQQSTIKLLDEARQTKQASMILRDQNVVTKKIVDREVVDTFNVVNEELRKKVGVTAKLRARLEKQLQQTTQEITSLLQSRSRVKHMLEERQKPLKVAQARLTTRRRRPSTEQINDQADRTLQNEAQELQHSVSCLQGLVNNTAEALSKLERSKDQLESDLRDKTESLRLDRACLDVNRSPGRSVGGQGGSPFETRTAPKGNTSQFDQWQKQTNLLLVEAGDIEQVSMRLRQDVAKTIASLSTSHTQALGVVNDALRCKVKQTKSLYGQLQANHRAVCHEIDELHKHREQIRATLAAKEAPLEVVKQRLDLRKQRPDREAIRDAVEEALQQELTTLKDTIAALRAKLQRIDAESRQLERLKRELERDLSNKGSALQQDKRALAIDLNAITETGSIRTSGSVSARSEAISLPSIRSIGRSIASSSYVRGSQTYR